MHHWLWVVGLALVLAGCAAVTPPMAPATLTLLPAAAATPLPTATYAPTVIPMPTALSQATALSATTATPVALLTPQAMLSPTAPLPEASATFTLTVLYDNVAYDERLRTDWGFACLVQGPEQTVLFDTGGKGAVLLRNMRVLGVDPQAVDAVVLSHAHADHTGGLADFLAENPRVTVYLPATFPRNIKEIVRRAGATLVEVTEPLPIGGWAYVTGAPETPIPEQALALMTPRGVVVITGCAHPGVVALAQQAQTIAGGEITLLLGGFHLQSVDTAELTATLAGLQALGVQHVAPSHCTGEGARRALAEAFGPGYYESGAGRIFVIAAEE